MAVQRIRDPLHDLIEFRVGGNELERVLWDVVRSRPFQRLRRIKQLGFSDLVYPGASHSRFAHSLGVFHTARQLMEVVSKHTGTRQPSREQRALAAALVHDLGHGPFSHAFEKVGERLDLKLADHEHVSDLLIRNGEVAEILNRMGTGFAVDVADIVKKEGGITVHNAVVSSQFDADRLDYMRRDRLMTGTQHSAIDFTWLLANLEIASVPIGMDGELIGSVETFVIGPKAIYAAEAYVLGLFQLYPTVYFHKATRAAEKHFLELLVRVIELARSSGSDKAGLPHSHPIIVFAKDPESLESMIRLDDSVFWGAVSMMVDAEDTLISNFAQRLRDRKLFKCVDIRARVTHAFDPDSSGDPGVRDNIDTCCAGVSARLTTWTEDNKAAVPRILLDEATRSPYRNGGGSKGPIERINVRTSGNNLVDLKQRSPVVASLETYNLSRAYFDEFDSSAREVIENIVEGEIKQCRRQ
jgi:uncharacterized protein